MVWISIKEPTFKEIDFATRHAVSKSTKPLFYHSKTKEAKELIAAKKWVNTIEKKLTINQSIEYNKILDEQRRKETARIKRRHNKS